MVPCYEGVGFDACGGMRKDLRFPEWGWRLQAIFSPSSDRVRNLRTDFLKTPSCSLGSLLGLCMGHKRNSGCGGDDTGTVVITKRSGMATGTAWLAEILIESRVSKNAGGRPRVSTGAFDRRFMGLAL